MTPTTRKPRNASPEREAALREIIEKKDASKAVPVRIPPELVDRIDALRGSTPREKFVRDLLSWALDDAEALDA